MRSKTIYRLQFTLYASAFTILLCSCTPHLYAPNTLNMPLAHDKHEGKIKVYSGLHDFGYQGSYSIFNHLVAFTDGSFYRDFLSTNPGSSSRTLIEGGLGFFQKIDTNGCFEILGGYGNGTSIGYYKDQYIALGGPYDYFVQNLTGNYQKLYIQPDIGFAHHGFEAGVGIRVSVLYLHDVDYRTWDLYKQTQQVGNYQDFRYNQQVFLLEPGIHIAYGDDAFKVFFSYGGISFQSGSYVDATLKGLFLNTFFSGGLSINLGRNFGN